jgi:hypothetical protein
VGAEKGRPASAQVILSDRESAERVAAFFTSRGFEAGALVGTSFAISAPADRFEDVFGRSPDPGGGGEAELPSGALPAELRESVEAIAVTGPPDFGPTDY